MLRRHLEQFLERLDCVQLVGQAGTVKGTIEVVDASSPDVVILDIQMPDGSGIKALRRIKKSHPEATVIMLTNHTDSFYRSTCMRAGASYFFDKANEFEQVSLTLKTLAAA